MKRKLKKLGRVSRFGKDGFSKRSALMFAVIFAGIGTYVIVRSFAATPETTANLWMDADGGSCAYSANAVTYDSATACDSFSEACSKIQGGKLMIIKAGNYTGSETSLNNCNPSSTVEFRTTGTDIANTTSMNVEDSSNVSVGGLYMNIAGNGNGPGVYMVCSSHITIHDTEIEGDHATGSSYGDAVQVWPVDSQGATACYNKNIVLDRMFIHDLHTYVAAQDNHTDCIQASAAEGLTLKNSRLVKCGTQSFQLNDDQWPCYYTSKCASLKDVTLENNWIGMGGTVGGLTNLTVRGNTFSATPNFNNNYNKGVVNMTGNVFVVYSTTSSPDYQCSFLAQKGVATTKTFKYNLSNAVCPGTCNKQIQAYSDNIDAFYNVLFVNGSNSNSGTWDLHLKSGANFKILDSVPASLLPSTDYDGNARIPDPNGNVAIGAVGYSYTGGNSAPLDVCTSISGNSTVGQALTTTTTGWMGSPTSSLVYQWQRCTVNSPISCTNISGATNSSYTLVSADDGFTVRVKVTASNSSGSANFTTDYTAEVQPGSASAPTGGTTSISGTTNVGSILTASTTGWSGSPTPTYAYQWQRCNSSGASCVDISGATNTVYTLVSADAGSTIKVKVTATNSSGSANATSIATAVVAAAASLPQNTILPAISGTVKVASTLTASNGTWNNSPTSYAYQWQRCNSSGSNCISINGATTSSRKLTCADYGPSTGHYTIRVVVTATNTSGNSSATSSATVAVTKAANTPKADFNDDCYVNGGDVNAFAQHWRSDLTVHPADSIYDIATSPSGNGSGGPVIDGWDLNALVSDYGYSG